MEKGKVPENVLKRSVMKQITKRRPEVVLGSGVGEDCAAVQLEEDEILVMSTDPITGATVDIGDLAVLVTVNDLASSGAEPIGILLTIMLPVKSREIVLKNIMSQVSAACAKANVQIMGGHTEVTDVVNQPLISVTGVGKVKKGKLVTTSGGEPGMDILVTKWIGLEGTSIIAKEKEEELLTRLPASIINRGKNFDSMISVLTEGLTAAAYGVAAMHDITEGGIFGALWEVGEASGVGMEVDLKAIPIRQETVEICEFFNINPYQLISSGSMLMLAKDGEGLKQRLEEVGVACSIIGKTMEENDRVIVRDGERRFLEPPATDELYKVFN
ncbi:MAG: AIR synthase family protein [Lachnospiraceae bacterium]|nr:AIR synthase family protein [Lachnospiraceae bacterium]